MKLIAIFASVLAIASAFHPSSVWTLQELSDALQNPGTNPALIPYFEEALNHLMQSIYDGNNVDAIVIQMPENNNVVPTPTLPEIVSPIPQPPVSGPLVQLIVNVNSKSVVAPSPVAPVKPEIIPGPVDDAEEIIPGPIIVDHPEENINGPVIIDRPEIINPIDVLIPLPAPVNNGDVGILV